MNSVNVKSPTLDTNSLRQLIAVVLNLILQRQFNSIFNTLG